MKAHPIFVPFGFRDTPEDDLLRQLAYPKGTAGSGTTRRQTCRPCELKGILDIIMNAVVASAHTAGPGQSGHHRPAAGPQGMGIEQGDSEYDPDYVWK